MSCRVQPSWDLFHPSEAWSTGSRRLLDLEFGDRPDSALNKFNPGMPCPGNNCSGDSEAGGGGG